jgi:hypothetical protein
MPISGEKLQDKARDTALALLGVSHGRSFTEQLDVYKVAGKVFLIVTDDPDERIITLQSWIGRHGVGPPRRGKRVVRSAPSRASTEPRSCPRRGRQMC